MSTTALDNEFFQLFTERISFYDLLILRDRLVKLKNKGMGQKTMLANFEKLRSVCESEEEEDVLLNLMDYVVGYCKPSLSIF